MAGKKDPLAECRNCCYFDVTEDPFWKGKAHCCFHEWGHGDWEKAPCDEEWEREERESYADPYPEEEWEPEWDE